MARKPGYKNPNAGRNKIPLVMSLPEKTIVMEQILYWIDLQATQEEVAGSFHVSVETLNNRLMDHFGMNFSELRKRTDGAGKLSLRRFQFNQAKKSATMAIWLGKHWLGQRDNELQDLEAQVINVSAAVREIQEERRRQDSIRSFMEDKQPLLDQGQRGEKDKVLSELGTTPTVE